MKVKQTIIKKVDLKKLMRAKGIGSIYLLSKMTGVAKSTIYQCKNGHMLMTEDNWNKIKNVL